ncbi:hypothetical protein EMIT0P201_10589 [Pseudomonas chlororaphis]
MAVLSHAANVSRIERANRRAHRRLPARRAMHPLPFRALRFTQCSVERRLDYQPRPGGLG